MAPSFLSVSSVLLLGALWSAVSAGAGSPLEKRGALLSPRQRECVDPGYIPACGGAFPCRPPDGICCSIGWAPAGSTCCSGGRYVIPPDTCPDGTDEEETTVTFTSDIASTTEAPTMTLPPTVDYIWYTWTITYWYYYYYYTYIDFSAELTSTETTYYTTVSLTATDEAEASSLIASVSSTLSYQIPTQTATPTSGSAPDETSAPGVSASPTAPSPTGNITLPTGTAPIDFTGAAASLRVGTSPYMGSFFVLMMGAFMVIPGVLMLWL